MDLPSRYEKEIRTKGLQADPVQRSIVASLQALRPALEYRSRKKPGLISRLWPFRKVNGVAQTLGCYLWGGVGRGKSWMMDMFLSELNGHSHARMHYLEFIRQVHMSLQQLRGQTDPLRTIARRFTEQWRVIGIDEFAVTDVADAMIWHGLIEALAAEGAILIITSNIQPEDLYQSGLQRERFLPAIEMIQSHMTVLHVSGEVDYRRRFLAARKRYYYPADHSAEMALKTAFQKNFGELFRQGQSLLINRRRIQALQFSEHSAWFEFSQLCQGPRSASDYIEIAKRFRNVFISKVPLFDEHMDDQAWRFIQLIDELYDQRIKVFISADGEPEKLYRGRRYINEFARTISRLYAMQDNSYGKRYA